MLATNISSTRNISKALFIIISIIVLASGVTYAALQSQQIKLTGNTIQTATASLQISPDGNTYSNSSSGFVFSNLVPGGQAMPISGYTFYLKNAGGTPLGLRLSVSSALSNPDNVDLTKVNVIIAPIGGGSPQSFPLESLISTNQSGGTVINYPTQLNPGTSNRYTIQVSMASEAVSGSSATLANLDFAFSGVALSN